MGTAEITKIDVKKQMLQVKNVEPANNATAAPRSAGGYPGGGGGRRTGGGVVVSVFRVVAAEPVGAVRVAAIPVAAEAIPVVTEVAAIAPASRVSPRNTKST